MKLNQDCVRSTLLELEEKLPFNQSLSHKELLEFSSIKNYSKDEVFYCLQKLKETNFIDMDIYHNNTPTYDINSITWDGHKFLDNIRDDQVWANTKSIVSKFSSVSINMIEKVASNIITNIISKHMGL